MQTATRILIISALLCTATICQASAMEESLQSPLKPPAAAQRKYPRIVLYSVSWCPHCKAAKEYLTRNNIPFLNRDVEVDDDAMDDLTKKYKSQGVPVIVIGNDEVILKGFDQQKFEKAVKDMQKKN
ncbi:glutaredoxin family protein [Geotalea daltonii FRC-32]|uniref:Glutaredoxin family protein n=1 Tax=Geotalea daltonii (strain DSM 22248 / JCM 15807 / FRC-32) TaxID=316067 RepID=B9LZ93_GEODF|nr:glutaredoxin domain-containing protein [Geotalea daltonii]ACM20646.1 glutaredoxin family protein [Geotalea daltonii FRC-32]